MTMSELNYPQFISFLTNLMTSREREHEPSRENGGSRKLADPLVKYLETKNLYARYGFGFSRAVRCTQKRNISGDLRRGRQLAAQQFAFTFCEMYRRC